MKKLPEIETAFPFRLRLRQKKGKHYYAQSNDIVTHTILGFAALGVVPVVLIAWYFGAWLDPDMLRLAVVVLPIAIGLVLFAAFVAETRTLEYEPRTKRVSLVSKKLGSNAVIFSADVESVRLIVAPLRVRWAGKFSLWWSGHGALVESDGHMFILCCQKRAEHVEEFVRNCPEWLGRGAVRCERVRELSGHRRLW